MLFLFELFHVPRKRGNSLLFWDPAVPESVEKQRVKKFEKLLDIRCFRKYTSVRHMNKCSYNKTKRRNNNEEVL